MKKFVFILSAFAVIFFINSGCGKQESKKEEDRVIKVITQPAEKKSLRSYIEAVGTLIPYEEVNISSEVDGRLTGVPVYEGTVVGKGTLLATVDDTDYVLEVKQANSSLKQAEVSLANTKTEYARKAALIKEGLITKEEFDAMSTRLSLAESDVDKTNAFLDITKQRLHKTKIYSPISGVIKEKKVSAGDNVRNGANLFTVIQTDKLKLTFTVSEKYSEKIKTGQDVLFTVDSNHEREFKGKVSLIYPNLDDKTRTLRAEAIVENQGRVLKPGLFARVTLYTGQPKAAIVVPVTALLYEADKVKVFTIEGDMAKERLISIGIRYGDLMEIADGLKEGEKVVTVGQQNLSEGVKVRENVAR